MRLVSILSEWESWNNSILPFASGNVNPILMKMPDFPLWMSRENAINL
jgi:hypothetical protein